MAYLSREFWKSDDDRQRAASAASPVGSELAPGAGSANPVASSGSAPVDPGGSAGAIRSFFDANKDQGAKVLGGLADSINQRIGATAGNLEQTPEVRPNANPVTPGDLGIGGSFAKVAAKPALDQTVNVKIGAYNADQQAAADKGKEIAAKNTAAAGLLAPDVQNLGAGQEGIQSLLGTQNAASGYTPGQARLDAWLAGAASNANPGAVGGTLGKYGDLKTAADVTQRPGAASPTIAEWMKKMYDEAGRPIIPTTKVPG